MSSPRQYYVYIATNYLHSVLYTGITNDIGRRMWEHKNRVKKSFASRYEIDQLVFYEAFNDINEALDAEKKIKGGSRKKKIDLIESINPEWINLIDQW